MNKMAVGDPGRAADAADPLFWSSHRFILTKIYHLILVRLVGNVRMRQIRSASDSCQISGKLNDVVPQCYASYPNPGLIEDRSPFGPAAQPTK